MSRTNQLSPQKKIPDLGNWNLAAQLVTLPANGQMPSRSSPLIQNDITTINLNLNFGTSTSESQGETLTKICSLLGQQMQEVREEKERKRKRRFSSRRRSRRSDSPSPSFEKSELPPGEVDAMPLFPQPEEPRATKPDPKPEAAYEQVPAVLQEVPDVPAEKKKKPVGSCEYQDLHGIHDLQASQTPSKPRKYRLVPSKHLKAVPEDQLPKKKFAGDRKRREYVELGKMNSVEVVESASPELRSAERAAKAKRSAEAGMEIY